MIKLLISLLARTIGMESFQPDSGEELILIPKSKPEFPNLAVQYPKRGQKKLKVKTDLLPINEYCRSGEKLQSPPLALVIHWVANPKISAAGIRWWFGEGQQKQGIYASTHYVIGKKGEIIQMLPDNEVGYHVGARKYMPGIQDLYGTGIGVKRPNYSTIGIECCHNDWSGKMNMATITALEDLCVDLLVKYPSLYPGLRLHYDFTGKKCHKWFLNNPVEWTNFKERVYNRVEVILS